MQNISWVGWEEQNEANARHLKCLFVRHDRGSGIYNSQFERKWMRQKGELTGRGKHRKRPRIQESSQESLDAIEMKKAKRGEYEWTCTWKEKDGKCGLIKIYQNKTIAVRRFITFSPYRMRVILVPTGIRMVIISKRM